MAEQSGATGDTAMRAGQAADDSFATTSRDNGESAHAAAIGRLFQDHNRSLVSYDNVRHAATL